MNQSATSRLAPKAKDAIQHSQYQPLPPQPQPQSQNYPASYPMAMPLQIPQNPIVVNNISNIAPFSASQIQAKSLNSREAKRELARRMRLRIQQEREEHDILSTKPNSDPDRESVRKNIQQRIRMRMIRKGHIPPNPTLEELQMCGLQPISTPYDYQQPSYFQQPNIMSQPSFPSYQKNQQQSILPQPSYGLAGSSSQGTSPITMQPIPHSANYQPILMKPSTCKPIFPKSNTSESMQPILKRPIYDCHAYFEHTTEIKESHPEPFLLPEREDYSPNTFESFFGGDFVLEKYQ